MEVTRKGFIASVGTALVAAAALPSSRVFADALLPETGISGTAAKFAAQAGSSFDLGRSDGTSVPVVLREVIEHKSHAKTEQFSLVFATRNGAALPEGTYTMRHGSLGAASMFLAPLGQAESASLRADFNLLRA